MKTRICVYFWERNEFELILYFNSLTDIFHDIQETSMSHFIHSRIISLSNIWCVLFILAERNFVTSMCRRNRRNRRNDCFILTVKKFCMVMLATYWTLCIFALIGHEWVAGRHIIYTVNSKKYYFLSYSCVAMHIGSV